MIATPTNRFLNRELEHIRANMIWLDNAKHPALADEYRRRYTIISDLLEHAETSDMTVTEVEGLLADAKQVLRDLSEPPGRADVSNRVRENLLIDIDYLTGLHERLLQSLEQATVVYALEGVARL